MKNLCSVLQNGEEPGSFKKFQQDKKKMLVKNTEKEENELWDQRDVPRDPKLEKEGADLPFCALRKTLPEFWKDECFLSLNTRNQGRSVKLLKALRLMRMSNWYTYPNSR